MPKRERLEQIDKRIKQLKRDASRIAARLIEQDDNSLIAEAMREQSQVLEIEYTRLSQETTEINTALEMAVMNEQDIGRLIEFMRGALEGLQTATLDDKRIILEILGTKVTLKEDMAIVTYRISASPVDMLTLSNENTQTLPNNQQFVSLIEYINLIEAGAHRSKNEKKQQ